MKNKSRYNCPVFMSWITGCLFIVLSPSTMAAGPSKAQDLEFCRGTPESANLHASANGLPFRVKSALVAFQKSPSKDTFVSVLAELPSHVESGTVTNVIYDLGNGKNAKHADVCKWVKSITNITPSPDTGCEAENSNSTSLSTQTAQGEYRIAKDEVFFGWNKCNITAEADESLSDLAVQERSHLNGIIVVGHTDTSHSKAYAMKLSQCRANAVKSNLVGKGILENRIRTYGVGEDDLRVNTGDGVKEPQNRRALLCVE
ncbi:MAG: OmpA family protein [Micropepsaceae bacterium]